MKRRGGDDDPAYKRLFFPEFRNRLDARIRCAPLQPKVMRSIAEKFIKELAARLAERDVALTVEDAAIDRLIEVGFDKQNGAGDESGNWDHIRQPLADGHYLAVWPMVGRWWLILRMASLSFGFPINQNRLAALILGFLCAFLGQL